jgi:hypothetical protein
MPDKIVRSFSIAPLVRSDLDTGDEERGLWNVQPDPLATAETSSGVSLTHRERPSAICISVVARPIEIETIWSVLM